MGRIHRSENPVYPAYHAKPLDLSSAHLPMKKPLVWIALAALVFVGTHFVWLADMPERMATHFNAAGKANGWMNRREHGALMLIFGLGSSALVLGLCWAIRYLQSSLLKSPRPTTGVRQKTTPKPATSFTPGRSGSPSACSAG